VSTPQYPPDPQGQGSQDPNYPTQPGYPPQPNYPPHPGYPPPAYPTQPLYPQYGEQQPGYPGQPAYPTQPGFGYGAPPSQYPGQPPYGGPPQPPKPNRTPLIIGIVAAIVLLCVVLPGTFVVIGALRLGNGARSIVADVNATLTAEAASETPTVATEQIIYQNPMDGTQIDMSNNDHCAFKPDGYHITASYVCFAPPRDVGDVDVTVTATQVSGPITKFFGISLRSALTVGDAYAFEVDSNGKWAFDVIKGDNATSLVDVTPNAAIKTGLGASNTLRVRAVGSHFTFFVNGVQVGQVDDATYASGLLGLFGEDGMDVAYTNFKAVQPSV
jgi:hypothetical protein